MVTIYRTYNRSTETLEFITHQGRKISLSPGSAIDLYSFEVKDLSAFTELADSDKLNILAGQSLADESELTDALIDDLRSTHALSTSAKQDTRDADTTETSAASKSSKKRQGTRAGRGRSGSSKSTSGSV